MLGLSISEARALGELLLELADVARPRLRPWYLRRRDRRSSGAARAPIAAMGRRRREYPRIA
jgi:hypothetical protein